MSFARERKNSLMEHGSSRSFQNKKFVFKNDSESEDEPFHVNVHRQGPPPPPPPSDRARSRRYSRSRSRSKSPEQKRESVPSSKVTVRSGPVVLDKFGNFRLAQDMNKPPEPPISPPTHRSRSRSRGRKYSSSRSRSRSRSLRRGRSRSGSYMRSRNFKRRSRSISRSRSRSFRSRSRSRSYSRSRSNSRDRRYERSNYKGPKAMFERGAWRSRPRASTYRGRGGDRGSRSSFRSRGGRGGRFLSRYSQSRSPTPSPPGVSPKRETNKSDEEDKEPPLREKRSISWDRLLSTDRSSRRGHFSPRPFNNRRRGDRKSRERERPNEKDTNNAEEENWDEKPNDENPMLKPDSSLEEMEQFIFKAKKENKEDMIERNKDLLKKGPI